ncbi:MULTISPECIES: tRNA-uridine aminocarboxypropyltransferase [Yersiniaceae]|uniref:tRNA-uridine aminocarboxypropyltransferase n=2 Tax=Yersiniaceae TaxID=1903411 RepID=A0A2N5EHL7_9GAMM|nr:MULTISPECIES: tRNA-uridine aminocarboxypropyltransferase [Yersiniaceae]MBS0971672.1 DTW domain-containing protein [Nissabacter archeti]PLR29656.1 DTW domain-containing protein [Chimaeribacter arupi]PLR43613.1 DTW domain-containing protein [Chimaeribacter arupi]
MPDNAVLRLRRERLARSTRPYRARGCRVIRCQRCLLPQVNCLCDTIVPQPARSRFCLVMFDTEALKPSNTGRLIADILPDTQAFVWSRTETDPALLAAVADPARQPYVVFPDAYAEPGRQVFTQLPPGGKPPLFIMLDGTWTEAKKMFRKSPYLNALPMFSLNVASTSRYLLREAQRPEQHCTAEVAAVLLEQAGDAAAATGLATHFHTFRERYLAGKPHRPVEVTA